LPADLPGGNYEWHAGVYQEPLTAQGRLTVQAADGNDERVIINTGTQVLTLRHEAQDRALFAEGALCAAAFLIGKGPGLYGMEDMTGQSEK
jgi:hypothetical protein